MNATNDAAMFTAADALELEAIGEAIFAEWYPNHSPGDPIPAHLPQHVMADARELAGRGRMAAARRRGLRAA